MTAPQCDPGCVAVTAEGRIDALHVTACPVLAARLAADDAYFAPMAARQARQIAVGLVLVALLFGAGFGWSAVSIAINDDGPTLAVVWLVCAIGCGFACGRLLRLAHEVITDAR